MSIHLKQPINAEGRALLEEHFGSPVAGDSRNFLYNETIGRRRFYHLGLIMRATGQDVQVRNPSVGHERTLDDGSVYRMTPEGWKPT